MSLQRLLKSVARDLLPHAGLDFRTAAGLHLFIPDRGAWSSAGEVFFTRVYDPFYPHLNEVRHWVDLGCNHGFFSFGLLDYLFRQTGRLPDTRVVLGDANEICVARVQAALAANALAPRWQCRHTVIGPAGTTVCFDQHKDSLGSNIFGQGRSRKRSHQYATTDISAELAGETDLFDLLKIDIEGAEKFLFENHLPWLGRFRFGICEWHDPVFPGLKLQECLRQAGWTVLEMHSQGVDYDLRQGDSWASPMGMALWQNPHPTR
jgi:FkbM family methyltransferase